MHNLSIEDICIYRMHDCIIAFIQLAGYSAIPATKQHRVCGIIHMKCYLKIAPDPQEKLSSSDIYTFARTAKINKYFYIQY
jgi:hypothetical protein